MKKAKKPTEPNLVAVAIYEAKPNPMFTEEQRQWIRFLRYNRPIACAECGKKSKKHWTALCEFTAKTMSERSFSMGESGKIHLPLTPVCDDHPLGLPKKSSLDK